MKRLIVGDNAPDFTLPDYTGKNYTLSELLHTQHVLLVFNFGFS